MKNVQLFQVNIDRVEGGGWVEKLFALLEDATMLELIVVCQCLLDRTK